MSRSPVIPSANLSPAQMRAALPKIERRLKELGELDPATVKDRDDQRITRLETAMEQFLRSVFGHGTIEYARYSDVMHLDTASYVMGGTPLREVREGLEYGLGRAKTILEQIRDHFLEEMGDADLDPTSSVLRAYNGLSLHPEIDRAASGLFRDEHYANAIEDAVKALNGLVRLRSGVEEDGDSLMRKAFSPNAPILAFNSLSDESDRSEQRGYMELFTGAVAGLRNPRAHKLITDTPERAVEFIAFVSMLAKLLDGAKKV